jgi:integrase
MSVVLTQSYGSGRVIRIPTQPQTVGDHRPSATLSDANLASGARPNRTSSTTTGSWRRKNPQNPLRHGNYWRRNIKPIHKKHGLDWVNFQVLRRAAATLLNAQGGADSSIIAAQWSHTVNVSTNVYNKVGIERQLTAVTALETALLHQPTSVQ